MENTNKNFIRINNQDIFFNKWYNYIYKLDEILDVYSVDNELITKIVNNFKENIVNHFNDNQIYLLQVKVAMIVTETQINTNYTKPIPLELEQKMIRSITYIQRFEKGSDEESYMNDIIREFWLLKSNRYVIFEISSLIFTYKLLPKEITTEIVIDENGEQKVKSIGSKILLSEESILLKSESNKKPFKIEGINLPTTMDLTKWGLCLFNFDYSKAIIIKNINKYNKHDFDNLNYEDFKKEKLLTLQNPYYQVKIFDIKYIIEYKFKNTTLFTFEDQLILNDNTRIGHDLDLKCFTRNILEKNKQYYFKEDKVIFFKKTKKVNFITTKRKDSFKYNRYLTLDLETRIVKNKLKPYCVSIFDGQLVSSFYLKDFINEEELLKNAIQKLFLVKNNKCNIYIHNFSYFDGIFLLRLISELSSKVDVIIRDNRLINVKVNYEIENKKYYINLRDSYLILPASLANLAKCFNVDDKGIFPYKFVTGDTPLDYIGKIPEYKFFDSKKVSLNTYIEYAKQFKNNWNLEDETIKYCELDCIILHKIIDKFYKNIYKLFTINIHNNPTLSSLAFTIYRSNFLDSKKIKIPIILGSIYNDLKLSYTGGAVDAYKPFGENLIYYDVNSLYPSVMKKYDMPVGSPVYFEGDIEEINKLENKKDLFGFYYVEVESPEEMNVPILQIKKDKFLTGNKTIAPLGKWQGWYFSEEIKNAEKYGYKFKIIKGYLFERANIFENYVDFLYNIKKNTNKDDPMYLIVKLLLNSIYGRFGMSPYLENHKILNEDESTKFCINYDVTNVISLLNGKELISYLKNNKEIDTIGNENTKNISIAIASAVTSYARVFMSEFKTKNNLYYSDTDSIVVDKPLPKEYVGDELGQFKKEYDIKEGVFLLPKVYGFIDDKNIEHVKFKGVKDSVQLKDLKNLLNYDGSLTVTQEQWKRDVGMGEIIVIFNKPYKLIMNSQTKENKNIIEKREKIYKNNIYVDTKPVKINIDD